jgi:hypothetical protein
MPHSQPVIRKQRLYGRQLEASVVQAKGHLVGTVLLVLHGPYDAAMESEYLYAASLARTWFGSANALALDTEGIPEIPDHSVLWEFLPLGTRDEVAEFLRGKFGSLTPRGEIDVMVDRLTRVQSLQPEARLVGSTGLQRYIGYKFGDDFVAFENPRLGNALYLLYGDWEPLSQLSRSELLASRGDGFDRIVHSSNWFKKLEAAIYNYRNS